MRGKEDPYLKIGEENDRSVKGSSDYVWAIRDINFEVQQGEVIGIIGRNGAGKSTLLKILSRTTTPTTGSVKIKGRVASLLEVGTGFHPELTGRENIFLNGAILGMTRHEIKNKFDEIVDFAGVERYIDTPVKRYSSGMYVRLAFGVAAHLEPEILIVDEVLAVGDAEFQKKALGKMKDVSDKDGRTVLFVSHNLGAVKSLCDSGFYLKNGRIEAYGTINTILDKYLKSDEDLKFNQYIAKENKLTLISPVMINSKNLAVDEVESGEEISFQFILDIQSPIKSLVLGIAINDSYGNRIATFHSEEFTAIHFKSLENKGVSKFILQFKNVLAPGNYKYTFGIRDETGNIVKGNDYSFSVFSDNINKDDKEGLVWINSKWSNVK